LTVTAALPTCPSLDAEIVAFPAATAETRPEAETVLIAALLEFQTIVRPVSTLLFASRVTAASCTLAPTARLAVAGDTDIDATGIGAGALTLRREELDLPSLEALIIALPDPTALTSPVA
jgi:hypothetical protein